MGCLTDYFMLHQQTQERLALVGFSSGPCRNLGGNTLHLDLSVMSMSQQQKATSERSLTHHGPRDLHLLDSGRKGPKMSRQLSPPDGNVFISLFLPNSGSVASRSNSGRCVMKPPTSVLLSKGSLRAQAQLQAFELEGSPDLRVSKGDLFACKARKLWARGLLQVPRTDAAMKRAMSHNCWHPDTSHTI